MHDRIAEAMMLEISAVRKETGRQARVPINSIYMMAHSGRAARRRRCASSPHARVMSKPSGELIGSRSSRTSRKPVRARVFQLDPRRPQGPRRTALKTANSGYLTRRLVDVAQDASSRPRTAGRRPA